MTLLTPKQAAEWAQVSERVTLEDIARGHLRARRIGARWRIHPDDLPLWGLEKTPEVGEVFDFPGGTIEASTSESKGANRGENPRPRRHQPVRHQAAP